MLATMPYVLTLYCVFKDINRNFKINPYLTDVFDLAESRNMTNMALFGIHTA